MCGFTLCSTAETYEACRNPGIPAFGVQVSQKEFYQAGEILHFSCRSGYKLIGEANIRCVPSRPSKWSHPPPVCKGSLNLQPIVKQVLLFIHQMGSPAILIVTSATIKQLSLFILYFFLKIPPFLSAATLEYVNERRLDGKNCHFSLPQAGFTLFRENWPQRFQTHYFQSNFTTTERRDECRGRQVNWFQLLLGIQLIGEKELYIFGSLPLRIHNQCPLFSATS